MDSHSPKVVVGICWIDVDEVEYRAIWRYLDVKVPSTARTAAQVSCAASIGSQSQNLESVTGQSRVTALAVGLNNSIGTRASCVKCDVDKHAH